MVDRIKVCLFNPRLIGKYMNDSYLRILLTIFMFFIIVLIPIFVTSLDDNELSSEQRRQILYNISSIEDNDIIFDGTKFIGTNSVTVTFDEINIEFLTTTPSNDQESINFIYGLESYSINYLGLDFFITEYSKLNISSFSLNEVKNGELIAENNFLELISDTYASYKLLLVPSHIVVQAVVTLIMLFVVVFVTYIFTSGLNQAVNGQLRLKIVLYSTIPFFVIHLFSNLFGIEFLLYISVCVPYIYSSFAIKSIMKIEIKR